MSSLADVTATDLAVRFIFGGFAVALSAAVSRLAGGRIGGVFAAFPAVFLSATITATLGLSGAEASQRAVEVSQGAIMGMFSNVVCALAASVYVRRYGTARGLVSAISVWLAVSCAIFVGVVRLGILS